MSTRFYDTDLTDAAWAWVAPVLPAARPGGLLTFRAVLNAIFYLLRTGCQWRMLPREFPPWGTVYHYLESIKKWVLKPHCGLGSRAKKPCIPLIGDWFPYARRSERIWEKRFRRGNGEDLAEAAVGMLARGNPKRGNGLWVMNWSVTRKASFLCRRAF